MRAGLPVSLALVAVALSVATQRLDAYSRSPYPLCPTPRFQATLALRSPHAPAVAGPVAPPPVPVDLTFQRGETLSRALQAVGLSPGDAFAAAQALDGYLDVRRIRPGDRYSVFFDDRDRPEALQFVVPDSGRVRLERAAERWTSSFTPFDKRVVGRTIRGTVDGSLVAAVAATGAQPVLAYKMAEVLQWDIDFARDLRRGDRFEVAYDALEVDGRRRGIGEIWALSFANGGRRIEAYRFGDDGGYYDGEGRPLEKMFLRSPLKFTHVTSRFNPRRFHPVLHQIRPHWGVDYRATVGTPVRVTAGGVVTFAGWSRGGGKTVKVRHANGYLSAYLHLSRFAPDIHPGRRVAQGQVVAYSGNTGLTTAPHLDYRVQHNGRWIDPLTLSNVPAEPIPTSRIADFYAWRDTCRASLELGTALPFRPGEAGGTPETRMASERSSDTLGSATAGR